MTTTIVTNNVPRSMIYGCDLTPEEARDFDYIDPDDFPNHDFFRYKGVVYDLSEVMMAGMDSPFKGWDGYVGETYFSGILVKFVDEDKVVVGSFYS